MRQILRVGPYRGPTEPQSLWGVRSRENETSDGDSFRFRLSCCPILSDLLEHVAMTALCLLPGILHQGCHHQDIPLALLITSLPGWKDPCQEVLFKACTQYLNLNNKQDHHIVHSDWGKGNFKAKMKISALLMQCCR